MEMNISTLKPPSVGLYCIADTFRSIQPTDEGKKNTLVSISSVGRASAHKLARQEIPLLNLDSCQCSREEKQTFHLHQSWSYHHLSVCVLQKLTLRIPASVWTVCSPYEVFVPIVVKTFAWPLCFYTKYFNLSGKQSLCVISFISH